MTDTLTSGHFIYRAGTPLDEAAAVIEQIYNRARDLHVVEDAVLYEHINELGFLIFRLQEMAAGRPDPVAADDMLEPDAGAGGGEAR